MLQHQELDPSFPMAQQFKDDSGETTILINVFDVDPKDHEAFKASWAKDAAFFARQPGYISTQLHQGVGGSRMFVNYAVWDSTAKFAATNGQPDFGPMREQYPDSATARPGLFRRVHIPDICVGETD